MVSWLALILNLSSEVFREFTLVPIIFSTATIQPHSYRELVLCGQAAFFSVIELGEKRVWSSSNPTIVLTRHEATSQ